MGSDAKIKQKQKKIKMPKPIKQRKRTLEKKTKTGINGSSRVSTETSFSSRTNQILRKGSNFSCGFSERKDSIFFNLKRERGETYDEERERES